MPNMFMVDIEGIALLEEEKEILRHPNVGSLILFKRNFRDREQLRRLVADVRALRSDIFIAIDHEGGRVQRFVDHGFTVLPAASDYGHAYDLNPETGLAMATHYGHIMASELMAEGIDVSLAPVLDLDGPSQVIGQLGRAFHADPAIVSLLTEAFITGMQKAGMPAVGKHFPGHGSCVTDSHVEKPIDPASEMHIRSRDLKPFQHLMAKKLLAAVVPAHVTYPAIDPDHTAGFSPRWLQTILRDELQFRGLVISDCLSMKGADVGDMKLRAERAVSAGCDMVILCNQSRDVLHRIVSDITIDQSEEALGRIAHFKSQMARFKVVNTLRKSPGMFSLPAPIAPDMHLQLGEGVADPQEYPKQYK